MVSQLVRLSEVLIAFGITPENVLLPFLYIILPFLTFIIPVACFFAILISFSRLSADGEMTALLAAGYSLKRAARPVLIFSLALFAIGAACASSLEAWGRRELVQFLYRKTQTRLDHLIKFKMQPGVFLDDFLGYVLYAENISKDRTQLKNLIIAPKNSTNQGDFVVSAPRGRISGSVEEGRLRLGIFDGAAYATQPGSGNNSILKFEYAEVDLLRLFQDQIFGADSAEDDFRSYPPGQLYQFISKLETNPTSDQRTYLRARYLFHQRIATPFAAVSLALFGMVLGIQDQRKGKSWTYAIGIITVIAEYVLLMGFKWLAEHGHISAPLAAWIPNLMLILFALFMLYQKNRLPPSEPTLSWQNFPLRRRFQ